MAETFSNSEEKGKDMSEDVTKIIDALCEKLGVAGKYLIPELARKNIVQDVAAIILSAVVVLVMAMVIRRIREKEGEDMFDNTYAIVAIIVAMIVIGIAFIVFAVYVCDLVGWLASPTAMAIEQITGMIKAQ